MKKLVALCLALLVITSLVGCSLVQKANEPVKDLEQSYTKAVKEYKQIKPQLDRDFKMLFGTKGGEIDTEAIKLQNYPDSGTPGLQDIVATQYRFYPKNKKKVLDKANQRAIEIYRKYKEVTRKYEEEGEEAGNALKTLEELTSQKEVSKEGLTLLTEFIKIAGEAYIQKQR